MMLDNGFCHHSVSPYVEGFGDETMDKRIHTAETHLPDDKGVRRSRSEIWKQRCVYTDVAPLFSGLVFAHANLPKLGIDEDGIGDKAIPGAGVAMLKQVGAQNAEVIVRDVGESWSTLLL